MTNAITDTISAAAPAQTILHASNQQELHAALAKATGGETILLSGGNYGDFRLAAKSGYNVQFLEEVKIVSADKEDPAVFAEMHLNGVSNVTFDGIRFDYTFSPNDAGYFRPFEVNSSTDVTIKNSVFDGDLARGISYNADGFGHAFGLSVRDSSQVTIENNEVYDFLRGMVFLNAEDVAVLNNDVHSIRSDGMDFAGVQGVLIEGNHLHDFPLAEGTTDHRDMIQFWTAGTDTPSTDIVIRGNRLDIGNGEFTQSIFMRNEVVDRGQASTEMYYRNVTIEDNLIVNNHLHGITVGETAGLTIRDNTVLHADNGGGLTGPVGVPQIRLNEKSTDVTVTGNVVSEIVGLSDQAGWTVRNNAFVQHLDPNAPGWYGNEFLSSSLMQTDGQYNILVNSDGTVAKLGAGAGATYSTPAGLDARFEVSNVTGDVSARIFDASASVFNGEPLPDETRYEWQFGDGTTARGRKVSYDFASGGDFEVKLVVTLPNGTTDHAQYRAQIMSPTLFGFGANKEAPLTLGASGVVKTVERAEVDGMLGSEEYSIDFTISGTGAGEIFRLHGSFTASVDEAGELSFFIFGTDGSRNTVTTSDANLLDGAKHQLRLKYAENILKVTSDGKVVAEAQVPALFAEGSHSLTFGNPWGKQNFTGQLEAFQATQNSSAYGDGPADVLIPEVPVAQPQIPASSPGTRQDAPAAPESGGGVEAAPLISSGTLCEDVPHNPAIRRNDPGDTFWSLAGQDLDLGAEGTTLTVSHQHLQELLGAETFAIDFDLSGSGSGELFRRHGSFVAVVNDEGELCIFGTPQNGATTNLVAKGIDVADGNEHNVSISYENDELGIWIDGTLISEALMTSPLSDAGRHDLSFGNPWGKKNFDGQLSSFELLSNPVLSQVDAPMGTLDLVSFRPGTGFQAQEAGHVLTLPGSPMLSAAGLDLSGTGAALTIGREHVSEIAGAEQFSIDFTLAGTGSGELFRQHQNFVASIDDIGEFVFSPFTGSRGKAQVETSGAGLADGRSHDVAVAFDDNTLAIWIDGQLFAQEEVGWAPKASNHDLVFGNPWDKHNFDGMLTSFEVGLEVNL